MNTTDLTSHSQGFGWSAALLGGTTAIGSGAFLGTLIANISLWLAISNGLSIEQAYAAMASTSFSVAAVLTFAVDILSGIVGGYISAKYGSRQVLAQGAAAGFISLLFPIIMYLGPSSQPGSAWWVAISLVLPPVTGLMGGYMYGRRI